MAHAEDTPVRAEDDDVVDAAALASKRRRPSFDLGSLPPLLILASRLSEAEVLELERQIRSHGGEVTDDPATASLFLGKVGTKERAGFELRCQKVYTEDLGLPDDNNNNNSNSNSTVHPAPRRRPNPNTNPTPVHGPLLQAPPRKRPKLERPVSDLEAAREIIVVEDSGSDSELEPASAEPPTSPPSTEKAEEVSSKAPEEGAAPQRNQPQVEHASQQQQQQPPPRDIVQVVKLDWLQKCLKTHEVLPLQQFVVYRGRRLDHDPAAPEGKKKATIQLVRQLSTTLVPPNPVAATLTRTSSQSILERARNDAMVSVGRRSTSLYASERYARSRRFGGGRHALSHGSTAKRVPRLLRQTTSENDEFPAGQELPPMPKWVREGHIYSCQRATLMNSPNEPFLEQLRKIKMARLLKGDDIGVRAYSTSIASIAAYPHALVSYKEITALPGCDAKIAMLFLEWKKNDGRIQEVEDIEQDESLQIMKTFYEIWGVGAATAREFCYDRRWADLDDVIEYGWDSLNRVQQIGLKYYEDFLDKIPRAEVESIASKVVEHARRVRDDGIECCIVGGYRRGKAFCGDVDIILSHRDKSKTENLVSDVVTSLEEEGWIKHTLLLALTNTKRDQQTLAFRPDSGGHGFDTLDKALVVWQDIEFERPEGDGDGNGDGDGDDAKNPNPHRRVDIIISPWSTVGCAIIGWSGGTTFQRDLRRYARKVKGWKFDSSGIRDRATGYVVDLEGDGGVCQTWMEAERKVFKGMGLVYREPWERCTD
jgi:DNA polymerase IV